MSLNIIGTGVASSLLSQTSYETKENVLEDFKLSMKAGIRTAQLAALTIPCAAAPLIALSTLSLRFGVIGALLTVPLIPDCIEHIETSYCDKKKQGQESNKNLHYSKIVDLSVGIGITAGLFYQAGKLISIIGKNAKNPKINSFNFYTSALTLSCLKYSFDAARFSFGTSFGTNFLLANQERKSKDNC